MRFLKALAMVFATTALVAACGGGDTEDRLDVRDPVVRLIHAVPGGPAVTLYRGDISQSDATAVGYKGVSRYYDVSNSSATWSVRTTGTPPTTLAAADVNPTQGDRYTFVALPAATSSGVQLAVIADPYNKALNSDKARVRVMHASAAAPAVDVYLMQPAANLATTEPVIRNLSFGQANPASDNDSLDVNGGTYRLVLTAAGTKTVVFNVNVLSVSNNADLLMLAIPGGSGTPTDVRVLVVQGNGDENGQSQELVSQP